MLCGFQAAAVLAGPHANKVAGKAYFVTNQDPRSVASAACAGSALALVVLSHAVMLVAIAQHAVASPRTLRTYLPQAILGHDG